MKLTLLTDFYELTMMQGYFKTGKNPKVIFDAFYRRNPDEGGYAICCGLDQVIDYVKRLTFSDEDISYLRSTGTFDEDFLEYLRGFHFSGDIYAIPEGTVVFPREPLVKIIAPIMEAQLMETAILNIINHQSLIATKAARVCYAAQGGAVMEFGLRRAQGPDAGTYGARAAVIGGCCGTSNVLTGQLFNVPVLGTHAHSWIMSFPDEFEAFRTYAELYPDNCTLLVDTYDTLRSGVPNAIKTFRYMQETGRPLKKFGIRLDSGDLAYMSKRARAMLDEAGFPEATITASSDLDEYLISSLMAQRAAINSWGVGTNLITSKDTPAFGGVYKLAALEDENGNLVPKIKLSDNTEKITNPGNKKIIRIYDRDFHKIRADMICLDEEVFDPADDLILTDPKETWKKTKLKGGTYEMRELLIPVFKNGECVYESPTVMEMRDVCTKEKESLWDETKRFVNPHSMYVDLSDKLFKLKSDLLEEMSMKQLMN